MNLAFFKKKDSLHRLQERDTYQSSIELTLYNQDLRKQADMLHLQEDDLLILKSIQPLMAPYIDQLVDQFYENLQNEHSLTDIIRTHSSIDRLKNTLKIHILETFEGQVNHEFVSKRQRIAWRHVKIGLQPKWYMCAFQELLLSISDILASLLPTPEEYRLAVKAVNKIFSLEQQLVLEAYEAESERAQRETEHVKERVREEVNLVASQLAAILETTNSSVSQLSGRTQDLATLAGLALETAVQTETAATKGMEDLDHHQRLMNRIQQSTEQIIDKITVLHHVSNEINSIVNIVKSIAEQTNLLALNAAIEAARAGDSGKGFAVVANEVRKLAEETKVSVSGVSNLILKINEQIAITSECIGEVASLTKESNEQMHEMNRYFETVLGSINENKEQNERTQQELSRVASQIQEASRAVSEIAGSAEQLKSLSSQI
ncbi:globin-coupled sensor protein [Ectobacillus ponti]|uniref:Globin-coupled sensor protein n=1 Tax=Ectobacillus ponti TaxID=2961894 RepID=A0AA41X973_9BACI|nr:globin-coupled sensor protein [Ectobacillus ponti]MCP8969185.1 globin-coupled sensor protein [Ectobacillus ponti]